MKGLSSIAVFLKEHFKVQTEKIATFSFPVHTGILKSHCAFPDEKFYSQDYFCSITQIRKMIRKCVST